MDDSAKAIFLSSGGVQRLDDIPLFPAGTYATYPYIVAEGPPNTSPPSVNIYPNVGPVDGAYYMVGGYSGGPSASGAWTGHEGDIAQWSGDDAEWVFYPHRGTMLIHDKLGNLYVYAGVYSGWVTYGYVNTAGNVNYSGEVNAGSVTTPVARSYGGSFKWDISDLGFRTGDSYGVAGQMNLRGILTNLMAVDLGGNASGIVQIQGVLSAPPVSPSSGQAWLIGPASTGAWATHEGKLAHYWSNRGWTIVAVADGALLRLPTFQVVQKSGTGYVDLFARFANSRIISGGETLSFADGYIRSNGFAATLPAATGSLRVISIKNTNASTPATITANGTDTIDGSSTYGISGRDFVEFIDAAYGAWDIL